ncbi:MAG: ABC transporter permease subunit [Rhodospirillales bacterium]|nr:ABC transporter permease subunit [Rhodospirillales bacterium]
MNRSLFSLFALAFGYAFLYGPIASVIVYSFNASPLVTVWAGFSTKWYAALFENRQMLEAAWLSIRIAAAAATVAAVLGTLAAVALARFRFPGRALFGGMIYAPMVMPEVVIGLALLLLFAAMRETVGWPETRGFATILFSHVTFAMAFVSVVVRARLSQMDRALEDAAMDLGATPFKAFVLVTLPLIAPAVGAGWLLAFTLSLDDLVIASFVSGPGSSTLPMVVYSAVRLGVNPQVNALATIIVGVVALAVGAAGWLMVGRGRRREREMAE